MKILGVVLLSIQLLFASGSFDYSDYSKVLIQNEGRYKPLDSYARHMLLEFSGKSTIKIDDTKYSALDWLNMVIFNHPKANSSKAFLINNPQIADAYNIKRSSDRRYSFMDLAPAWPMIQQMARAASEKESKQRNEIEREFLRVYSLYKKYEEHNAAFTYIQKHETFRIKTSEVSTLLELDTGVHSYIEVMDKSEKLAQAATALTKKDTTKWNTTDSTISFISYAIYEWTEFYKANQFGILPFTSGEEYWLSPWAAIKHKLYSKEPLKTEFDAWTTLYNSFNSGDIERFSTVSAAILKTQRERYPDIRFNAVDAEVTYNKWDFIFKSKLFYGFALLFALLALVSKPKLFNKISFVLLLLAIIFNTTGIGFRMFITERPPVTNLFETFIFTGLMTAIIGFFVEKYQKNGNGNLIGSFTALVLLLISGKYSSQGDTMGVLVAVLDSNFWLATHVITISLGYAGCVAAGVMGHVYILQALFKKPKEELTKTCKTLFGILGFGLALSFIGTVLGGIWADQSWGRFWGWDPKENGALLIVLWSAIIFHMRLAGWIKEMGVAVTAVIGIIMVMLAWFGINLLGVGLHSYGFTSGIAMNLIIYITLQIIFLVVVVPYAMRRTQE